MLLGGFKRITFLYDGHIAILPELLELEADPLGETFGASFNRCHFVA